MARQVNKAASGLRKLLIADRQRGLKRWATSEPDGWLEDLGARVPVVVSSAQLMCALMHAGLPHKDYVFGGRYFKSTFILDEHDQLADLDRELEAFMDGR
ncbi:hypothetical protein [Mycobacterium palustre]|uniref:Uncharacterized protein n=1 Tax=Mycobacterium palustre TaxID=153971 RepID=A0A1X1ZVJ8_9MYCO|nr:hypothetical protein [Mycobacterium palustre]MCV7101541.1 hypothetical protein [Mycobacterium palustre]ORW28184.1 hypothetical protein AWC19_27500 [Mycobacterium palustre]